MKVVLIVYFFYYATACASQDGRSTRKVCWRSTTTLRSDRERGSGVAGCSEAPRVLSELTREEKTALEADPRADSHLPLPPEVAETPEEERRKRRALLEAQLEEIARRQQAMFAEQPCCTCALL